MGEIYLIPTIKLRDSLKAEAQKLWQDVEGTKLGGAEWLVPYENFGEAERRIRFVDAIIQMYPNYFNSKNQTVKNFVAYLKKRLQKLELQQKQISFEFLDRSNEEKEIEMIKEFRKVLSGAKLVKINENGYYRYEWRFAFFTEVHMITKEG